jgi:hypothetical protein
MTCGICGVSLRDISVLVSNTGGYKIAIVAVRFSGSSHRERGLGGAVCFGLSEFSGIDWSICSAQVDRRWAIGDCGLGAEDFYVDLVGDVEDFVSCSG